METIIEIIKLISIKDYLSLGIGILSIGLIFWYFPKSKIYKAQKFHHNTLAQEWHNRGHIKNAQSLEKMHYNINKKAPFYGKILFIAGLFIIVATSICSILNAL